MKSELQLKNLLGPMGGDIVAAMERGLGRIDELDTGQLLGKVGQILAEVPPFTPLAKSALQDSFGGNQKGPSDDFLVGRGLFYLTEQRRLFLDCTAGHYQLTWGYSHRSLCEAVEAATRAGVIWDNHSNIPQSPLKRLAQRLVELGNAPGEKDPLGGAGGRVLVLRFIRIETLLQTLHHAPFVTLALAHGRNFGAGADLVCACSRRIATADAAFRMPGLRFGLVLGTRRLALRVGTDAARELLGSSQTFDVARARQLGFVERLVERPDWPALVTALGHEAGTLPATSLRRLNEQALPDTRAQDMAALVASASVPGLKERIRQFRDAG